MDCYRGEGYGVKEVAIKRQREGYELRRRARRFAGGKAFEHRGSEAKQALLACFSRRSVDAIHNGMGSIEFWWL